MKLSLQKRRLLANTASRFPIAKVQLFGSRARGDARDDSDYDLLIHFLPDHTPSLLELGDIHHSLSEALRADVDVVPFRDSLPVAILRDAKTVFERR